MSSENVREKNKEKLIEEDVYKIRNKLGEQIGKGAFSTVYKGQADIEDSKGNSIKKGEIIALKELSGDMDKETRQNIFNEFNISNELKHNSNIVKIIDVIEINGKVYIAYEFCNGGDLRLYMDYFGNFDEGLIQTIMMQIVNGLVELFKYNVVHHDIKPENILLKLFYDTNDPIKSDKDIEKIKEILKSKKNSEIKANQFQQFFPFTNFIYNNNYMNMNNMINMNSMMNQMFMNANNMSNINTMNMNMVPNNINTMNMNMVPYMVQNNMNTMNMNNNMNTMNMNNNMNTMNMNMNTININIINMNTNNNTINNPNTFNNNLNYNNNLMNENNNNLTNIGINNNIIGNNNMNNMGINNNTNNQMYDIQKLHIPSNFRENYYQQNSNNNNQNTNFNNFVNQNNCCNNNSLINNNFSNNESIQDNNNVQQIKNKKNDTFSEGKILSILKDSYSTEYKLSDFGLSKIREKITKRNLCGSPLYMSPELFRPETKLSDIENKQVDIWALGVLAYELFFGKRPFEAFSIEELSKMYDRGTFEIDLESTKDKTISKQFFNFLNMCLQKDPKKRANVAQLKDSDFLNYHINSLEKMDGIKFENYLEGKEIKTPKSIFQISIEKDYSSEIKRRKSNL